MGKASKKRKQHTRSAAPALTADARRARTVRIVGAVTVAAVAVATVGAALLARGSAPQTTFEPDPAAALPTGVLPVSDDFAYGVPYGAKKDDTTIPTLEIFEDFQCPACQSIEAANGEAIAKLADDGKIRLVWRPTAFLDRTLRNDSSQRAIAAWGCAIDAGKTREFHDAMYYNAPAKEGDGWTDEQLSGIADQAGITGEAKDAFTTCTESGKYLPWAKNATAEFLRAGITSTPTARLNGSPINVGVLGDAAQLEAAVAAAAPAPSASPSAAPSADGAPVAPADGSTVTITPGAVATVTPSQAPAQ